MPIDSVPQTSSTWRWLGKCCIKIWGKWHKFQCFWWRIRFRLEASGSLGIFGCDKQLKLNVPTRVGLGRGTLTIADNVVLGWYSAPKLGAGTILLEPRLTESTICIGSRTMMSNNVSIIAVKSIIIGERCLIGDQTAIYDCDFHEIDPKQRTAGVGSIEPVTIGNNVWIGSRVLILRGVTIGDNSVIAAGSIVTRSIPPNSLAAGVPAKVIRSL